MSTLEKNDIIQEFVSLNEKINQLNESFNCVHLEKGKIDEAFASLRHNHESPGFNGDRFDNLDLATQRISELQEEVKRLKAEDKGTSLSQFSSMETALKRSQERENELQHEVVNAEKKISSLEYQLKTTKEKLDTAELSIRDTEKQVLTLKEELLLFTKKEAEMAGNNKQSELLQKEVRDLKASISVYRQEISEKDADIKRLQATTADKQAIMEGYVAEITRMKDGAKTASSPSREYESFKLKFDDVCKERDSLQREVARLVAKKQNEVSIQLESQTVGYRKQLRDNELTIERLRSESLNLKSENEALRERAVSSVSQVAGREYDSLQRRYDSLWSEKEVLRKELDEIKTRDRSSFVGMENYRQEIREKEIAVDRLRSENITLQAQIEALKREAADISSSSSYTMRVQSSSVQLDSNEEFYRQEIRDRDSVIDRLKSDTMTLQTEIDGLKRDMSACFSRTEFEALKMKHDEIVRERDSLREQLMEARSTSERDVSIHFESRLEGYQQDVREREALIDRLRSEDLVTKSELEMLKREVSGKSSVSDGYLGEIERLRQDIVTLKTSSSDYEALKRTYDEVCKERDFVRNQLMEYKSQSENEITTHLESYMEAYRQDVREKEVAIDRMRSENTTLRAELEGLKREMSTFYKRSEYESLKLQFDEMWKERDALREELIVFKSKAERDVLIQVENKTVIFQREIREKEMECAKLRSEMMSIQMNLDVFKREVESKQHLIDGYLAEIERYKGDIITIKSTTVSSSEYDSLRRMYDDILKERDALRLEFIEFKSNSEREMSLKVDNQIKIYRDEIREKEIMISSFRSESMKFQSELETYKREADSKQFMIEGYLTEIDRLKTEISAMNKRIIEFESIKRSYEDVCRERDYIQRQFEDFKSRNEQDKALQIQIQTDGFRQEIKEKAMAIERFSAQNKLLIEEVDGLKRERTTLFSKTEYDSLRQQYEEMWKERDILRGQISEIKSKCERDLIVQVESRTETYRTEIREKETIVSRLQSESLKYQTEIDGLKRQLGNQEAYLVEIDRLKMEVNTLRFPDIRGSAEYISLQRSYEEICKERDGLRGQVVDIRIKGEQELEGQVKIYREEIREKEIAIDRLRSECMAFKAEIEGLKRSLGNQEAYLVEIESLKKEVNTLRFPDIRGSAEYISLQRSYEEICKERDGLRGQVVDIRVKGEQELEGQVKIYREEIREKEIVIDRLRSECMAFKAEIEGLKRSLGNQEAYLVEIESLKKEVNTLRFPDIRGSAEYISLQRSYEEVCKERDGIRGQVIDIRMKGEQELESQMKIYREEIREKEVMIEKLRVENMSFRAEVEGLKRDLGSQEAYLVEIDRLKKEVNTLRFPDIRGSAEYISLQKTYEEVCKERDGLRSQVIDIRLKGEQDLDNQVKIYREEIREKEIAMEKIRVESYSFKAEIDGLKRDLGNQEAYLAEIERLKKEVNILRFPDIRGSAEYISLQKTYEEVCRERDALRGQVIDIKMKGEQEIDNQVKIYREEIREKEVAMEKIRVESYSFKSEIESLKRDLGNQEAYLIEIDRLKKEVNTLRFPDIRGSAEYISLQRTYEEVCKERDGLRGQVIDIKIKGEQDIESQVKIYREEIKEKEVAMNNFRSEVMTLRAEIEGLKRELATTKQRSEMEVERVRKESMVISPSVLRSSAEFVSLQHSFDAACQERDSLRQQIIELRSKNEREVAIYIDNQVRVYRDEIKEKEAALGLLRSEAISMRSEIESLKRELRIAKDTPAQNPKVEQELFNLKAKYSKLQEEYDILVLAKSKLEEEMVIKINSGMADKQEYIYKLEKDNRELKSSNEYYEKTVEEKNAAISDMRLKIASLQKKIENLKKDVFVADEAYEKAELRLKEVLKSEYKPVTTYEVRRYRTTSTADSPTFSSSTSTYTVKKTSTDTNGLEFSATSTPMKSAVEGERSEVIRKSAVVSSAPLDSDLARAEGNFNNSEDVAATSKTILITNVADGDSAEVGSAGSAKSTVYRSSYSSQPSVYRTSGTTYRTTTGRTSVTGGSGYSRTSYPTGRKYSGRYSVTRKFY